QVGCLHAGGGPGHGRRGQPEPPGQLTGRQAVLLPQGEQDVLLAGPDAVAPERGFAGVGHRALRGPEGRLEVVGALVVQSAGLYESPSSSGMMAAISSSDASSHGRVGSKNTCSRPSSARLPKWSTISAGPLAPSAPPVPSAGMANVLVMVFPRSPYGRPTASQWSRSTSSLWRSATGPPRIPATSTPSGRSNRLQASAYCATSRRVFRSPDPPTRIGGWGCWTLF